MADFFMLVLQLFLHFCHFLRVKIPFLLIFLLIFKKTRQQLLLHSLS